MSNLQTYCHFKLDVMQYWKCEIIKASDISFNIALGNSCFNLFIIPKVPDFFIGNFIAMTRPIKISTYGKPCEIKFMYSLNFRVIKL